MVVVALCSVIVPMVWPHSPYAIDLGQTLRAPSESHPMGTDEFGRDVLARFLVGARISLGVGALVVLTGAVLGGAVGLCAGALGGITDLGAMRVMDAVLAFPALFLAMAVTIGIGAGITGAAIGLALASVPWYARVLRSEVLQVRVLPFVESAVVLGAARPRIIRRHIWPHVAPTLLIQGAASYGYAVLGLAALSFVGLGAQIPTPEWGAMITAGQQYALTGQWWISVFPGLGLLLLVTAANVIADRVREMLDPRGQYASL